MEGAGPGHGWRRGRPIKILAAAAVAFFLAAAGATVLLLHARPGRILVHVLPVGQDMSSATAIAVNGPDVWVANETDRWGGSVTELDASDGRRVRVLSSPMTGSIPRPRSPPMAPTSGSPAAATTSATRASSPPSARISGSSAATASRC